jgi:hypothetical protein
MPTSVIQVGLVNKTANINADMIQTVAQALSIQITRDVQDVWGVQANVMPLQSADKIPPGIWPIFLMKSLPPGEGGFHLDKHNQPYAEVIATPDDDSWTVDASHELIEMLVDPAGNRLQNSFSIEIKGGKIVDGTGQFSYLVEACDPCEADQYAYQIQGVAVSDFLTPHFYDPKVTAGTQYSFTGAITKPREILKGGYISWLNQETDEMQQLLYVDPDSPPKIVTLGPASGASLRTWVDNEMRSVMDADSIDRHQGQSTNKALLSHCRDRRKVLDEISLRRAGLYGPSGEPPAPKKRRAAP